VSWAFPFPIGFVALYTHGEGESQRKYTLPVVGAVRPHGDVGEREVERDPRWGTILVPAPAASPNAGDVVPAASAMSFEDGWTFQGIGYAEADDDEQGGSDGAAAADVPTPGP
jgi:hypothetical protein